MSLKDVIQKAKDLKAAVKAKQAAVLDKKVAKANVVMAEQKEISDKLKVIAKADKLKAKNKQILYDQSFRGKLAAGAKKAQENRDKHQANIAKREKKDKGSKPSYDPWNI